MIVRGAPQGSTVELTFNGGPPVSANADAYGDANLTGFSRAAESSVLMYVDRCASRVKVLLVERGIQPFAPEAGCSRTDIASVFVMRPVTTFVIDIDGTTPSVHLTQGPPPASWVTRGAAARGGMRWGMPTRGLVLSVGAGRSSFSKAVETACGDVPSCERSNFGGAVTLAADYWITPYLGAEASYMKPADVAVTGSSDTFKFESRLAVRLATFVGKAAVPVGPARLYGFAGLNRHESTLTMTETIGEASQTFAQKTTGWNWTGGGGFELWVSRWIALYAELMLAKIKGAPTSGGPGGLDERATFLLGGVRVRPGL